MGDTERLQRRRGRDRGRVCAQQPPTETQAAAGRRGGSAIVVEHRDRYCRFGAECIEVALSAQGRKVVVVDDADVDDLVRDVTDVLTSLCGRLHGERSARARAVRGVAAERAGGGDG